MHLKNCPKNLNCSYFTKITQFCVEYNYIYINGSLKYYILYILIFFISDQVKLGHAGFKPLYPWAFICEKLKLHFFYAFLRIQLTCLLQLLCFPKNTSQPYMSILNFGLPRFLPHYIRYFYLYNIKSPFHGDISCKTHLHFIPGS